MQNLRLAELLTAEPCVGPDLNRSKTCSLTSFAARDLQDSNPLLLVFSLRSKTAWDRI